MHWTLVFGYGNNWPLKKRGERSNKPMVCIDLALWPNFANFKRANLKYNLPKDHHDHFQLMKTNYWNTIITWGRTILKLLFYQQHFAFSGVNESCTYEYVQRKKKFFVCPESSIIYMPSSNVMTSRIWVVVWVFPSLDLWNLVQKFALPTLIIAFTGTVADNIRYGPQLRGVKLSDSEVYKLLTLADLDYSFYNKSGGELSVGQAQRVALARTLANEPEVSPEESRYLLLAKCYSFLPLLLTPSILFNSLL